MAHPMLKEEGALEIAANVKEFKASDFHLSASSQCARATLYDHQDHPGAASLLYDRGEPAGTVLNINSTKFRVHQNLIISRIVVEALKALPLAFPKVVIPASRRLV